MWNLRCYRLCAMRCRYGLYNIIIVRIMNNNIESTYNIWYTCVRTRTGVLCVYVCVCECNRNQLYVWPNAEQNPMGIRHGSLRFWKNIKHVKKTIVFGNADEQWVSSRWLTHKEIQTILYYLREGCLPWKTVHTKTLNSPPRCNPFTVFLYIIYTIKCI